MPALPKTLVHLACTIGLLLCAAPSFGQAPLDIDLFADVPAPGQPEGIAVAPGGTVFVGTNRAVHDSDPFPSVLFAYDASGQLVNQWQIQGQDPINSGLLGIALDGDGAVYVLDGAPPRALRIARRLAFRAPTPPSTTCRPAPDSPPRTHCWRCRDGSVSQGRARCPNRGHPCAALALGCDGQKST